jgi:hypothetical protein
MPFKWKNECGSNRGTKSGLDDFHRVENPRLMDEAYFEMVLEKYDELARGTKGE